MKGFIIAQIFTGIGLTLMVIGLILNSMGI